jgi:hypothetical protein
MKCSLVAEYGTNIIPVQLVVLGTYKRLRHSIADIRILNQMAPIQWKRSDLYQN